MNKYLAAWLLTICIIVQAVISPIVFSRIIQKFELTGEAMIVPGIFGFGYLVCLCVLAFAKWRSAILGVDVKDCFKKQPEKPHEHDWQPHIYAGDPALGKYYRDKEICIICKAERGKI